MEIGSITRCSVSHLTPGELEKLFDIDHASEAFDQRQRDCPLTRLEELRDVCLRKTCPWHKMMEGMGEENIMRKMNHSQRVAFNAYTEEFFKPRPSLYDFIMSQPLKDSPPPEKSWFER